MTLINFKAARRAKVTRAEDLKKHIWTYWFKKVPNWNGTGNNGTRVINKWRNQIRSRCRYGQMKETVELFTQSEIDTLQRLFSENEGKPAKLHREFNDTRAAGRPWRTRSMYG